MTLLIVGGFALLWCCESVGASSTPSNWPTTFLDAWVAKNVNSVVVRSGQAESRLRINNIRLDTPGPDAPQPSTTLKFDLWNDGAVAITDIQLQVAIIQRRDAHDEAVPRVMVGPFTVGGHATIEAGYTVSYEMVLRNLSSDCQCLANVRVVSARALPSPIP
jgi:hypothetical protein